jgi:hypothetical protein
MTFPCTAKTFAAASALAAGLVAAWSAGAAPATIAAFMVEVINPAANSLWNAGVKNTLSDEEWAEIKRAVATLSTAAVTVAEGGSMPDERERAKSAVWREWSLKLTATVQAAKRASDRKDNLALTTAGNMLVEVCEGCHVTVAMTRP